VIGSSSVTVPDTRKGYIRCCSVLLLP
jgi:hypothetical protein